jgi:hypothetical protein
MVDVELVETAADNTNNSDNTNAVSQPLLDGAKTSTAHQKNSDHVININTTSEVNDIEIYNSKSITLTWKNVRFF